MCEHCKEDFAGYVRPLDKNGHVAVFEFANRNILNINWYGHRMEIPIQYCPICRQKVGVELEMSEVDKLIDDIMKAEDLFFKIGKTVTKIKMKAEFYSKLVVEAQKYCGIIEVLDVNYQPLNTIMGVKIEIDNSIKKDYELVYN